jgi:hypothetical protein
MCAEMVIDVWMQHPTLRFLEQDVFASLRRCERLLGLPAEHRRLSEPGGRPAAAHS